MAVSGMTTGRDYSIGLYDGTTSSMVSLGSVQGFRSSARKHDIKSMPYNAPPMYGYIPDGYSGRFSMVRTDSQLEDLFLRLVALFNSGGDLIPGYINQTIIRNGVIVSRYQYVNSVFFLTEDADITRDKNVPQAVEWMASDKINLLA